MSLTGQILIAIAAVLVVAGCWCKADTCWERAMRARAYRKAQRASLDRLLDLSRPAPSEHHPAGRRYQPESSVIVANVTSIGERHTATCGCSYRVRPDGYIEAASFRVCSGHVHAQPRILAELHRGRP